jgi:hypothetical protein
MSSTFYWYECPFCDSIGKGTVCWNCGEIMDYGERTAFTPTSLMKVTFNRGTTLDELIHGAT